MKTILSVLVGGLVCISAGAQIPKLNSYSAAPAVIFLDFDGQYVQGTSWNWSGPIDAQSSGLSSAAITEIFNRVAEDYRIFNLNITTDSTVYASAPATRRTRVVVTTTYQWYGMAGGVAYVGSFTWGDDTPAWVFSGLLNNNVKNIAEAISHEAGHTLGLQHQSNYDGSCVKTAEYSGGQGSGQISWAPIMGVGYYKNITTWHNGPNAFGCTYLQDDIAVIAGSPNNIGLRSDDHGNSHQQASTIAIIANSFQANGLINTADDKDVFGITITSSTNFRLSAVPLNVGSNNAGADMDIRVSLLNEAGDTLSRYNPMDLLDAGIDTNLNSATYYLVVEGVGNANLLDYGSVGFYSLSGTLAGVLAVNHLALSGKNNNGNHQLQWNYQSDEIIKSVKVESSADAIHFRTIANLNSDAKSFAWQPLSVNTAWYRIKVIPVTGNRVYYSNIITLRGTSSKAVILQGNIINSELVIKVDTEYNYQLLDQKGSLLKHGAFLPGTNRVATNAIPGGFLLLRVFNNSGTQLFKLIKQ